MGCVIPTLKNEKHEKEKKHEKYDNTHQRYSILRASQSVRIPVLPNTTTSIESFGSNLSEPTQQRDRAD
jgi:hypothetical protein